MPEPTAGSHHRMEMVMSDGVDAAPRRFLSTRAPGPPQSLNNSARGVNQRAVIREGEGGGSGEGGDEEVQRKEES